MTSYQGDRPDREAWTIVALKLADSPSLRQSCPICQSESVLGTWRLMDPFSRKTVFELVCEQCRTHTEVEDKLPLHAPICWPLALLPKVVEALQERFEAKRRQIGEQMQSIPAASFAMHEKWIQAGWNGTTYKWHPRSEQPPLIGLTFRNEAAGLEIFRDAEKTMNHEDRFEEIRISIIEGSESIQESRPGYSVHICPEPDALEGRATMNDFVVDPNWFPFLGQWNRHYPILGKEPLLKRFKEEFALHGEYMLAPVFRGPDGQSYIEYKLGIVKNAIHFRNLSDISEENDIDSMSHLLPHMIVAP